MYEVSLDNALLQVVSINRHQFNRRRLKAAIY